MKRNWMKRPRQYRLPACDRDSCAYVRAAKWIAVNLSATPRMEGKGKERKREAEQPASDWYEWPMISLSPPFASSLSASWEERRIRDRFVDESRTPSSDSPADVRHKGFLDDWTKCPYHHSLALFLSRIYPVLFTRHLVSISRFDEGKRGRKNWIGD